jgi:arylsulfatase
MPRQDANRVAASVACLLAMFCLCGHATAEQPKTNVILLVLDQLQADRLHCYGNPRPTSPNIDRLAERGTRFSRFYSVAPWTAPSYATLMTGLFPSRHGVTLFWRPGMPTIDKDTPVLAEMFKQQGYYTAAFVNNSVAGHDETWRGFDEYYEGQRSAANITERVGLTPDLPYTAPSTLPRVRDWLDKHHAKPFFLWVLFWEPHSPYDPPAEHDLFKSDAYPHLFDSGYDIAHAPLKRLAMLGDPKAVERLYQLYDGKIHFIDEYVGQLMDHLRNLGLEGNTIVVLTSDHGELMYSHPKDYLTFDHRGPYDSVLHIPFIAAGPGVPAKRVVKGISSNLDSAPTMLELAGLPNLRGAQGKSLAPMMAGKEASPDPYVFGEEDTAIPWRSVRNDRFKLILNSWTGEKSLYDLQRDPGEQVDARNEFPDAFKTLDARLQEWMRENQPPKDTQRARWKIYTHPEVVQIFDEQAIGGRMQLQGAGWRSDTLPESGNYEGGCFWHEAGDGSSGAVWRGDNPLIGTYRISVFHGRPVVGKLASNAPFTVVSESKSVTVRVNFNEGVGEWNLLGTFTDPRFVSVSNRADGIVVVDAIKFVRMD